MIFQVRSARAVKISDMYLLRRIGVIVGAACVLLSIRTLVAPPAVIVGRTKDDLKAYLCDTDWWDHSFTTRKSLHNILLLKKKCKVVKSARVLLITRIEIKVVQINEYLFIRKLTNKTLTELHRKNYLFLWRR